MASQESCKQTLEITIPIEDVEKETNRVVESLSQRVRLPGFRPGKVPVGIIRTRFSSDIREEVIRNLVPKRFQKEVEDRNLRVVGTPDITDVHFHSGEPLRFKAEFEVSPEFELQDYRGLTVAYQDPEVSDDDVARRIEELREQKADYVNVDPRPAEDGDHAVVALEALSGLEKPLKQDEVMLHVGGQDTLDAFTENLRGMSPGDEKEFDVRYPEDFGDAKLAGKSVRFRAAMKGIRRKELPEINDEFAKDLGDYLTMDELRSEVRKSLLREKEYLAQQEAKNKLVEKLVEMHEFPVPEAFLDRQIENQVEQYLRAVAASGGDPRSVKLDWQKVRESQREQATKDVKASLLLERIADREAIEVMQDEVDREVQRIARQDREPVAAVRRRLEEQGVLRRIASRIRTEKTLTFLFEHARKVAED
ncbi:MAG TPA: trigger factor [Bryobacteraceae bacterium]|nr:trigger factor [Bryobacteraceae bacterium]